MFLGSANLSEMGGWWKGTDIVGQIVLRRFAVDCAEIIVLFLFLNRVTGQTDRAG